MRRELKQCLIAIGGAVLLLAAGCGEKASAGRDYTVRAQVVQPPDAATGPYIYHEAIDDWVSRDGKMDGMDAMAMPYPLAKGVPIAGIQTNDKIEVTVHVDWNAEAPVEITHVRELPPDTKLTFRAAKPPRSS
jgi:hypothetical protein